MAMCRTVDAVLARVWIHGYQRARSTLDECKGIWDPNLRPHLPQMRCPRDPVSSCLQACLTERLCKGRQWVLSSYLRHLSSPCQAATSQRRIVMLQPTVTVVAWVVNGCLK